MKGVYLSNNQDMEIDFIIIGSGIPEINFICDGIWVFKLNKGGLGIGWIVLDLQSRELLV